MARSWQEAVDLGDASAAPEAESAPGEGREGGMLRRLRASLSRSRQALDAELSASLTDKLDAEAFERIEEALILADVGAATTAEVVGRLEAEVEGGELAGGDDVRERLVELLAGLATSDSPGNRPHRASRRDDGRRRQRHRQDHDDRQARLASAPGARR